VTPEDTQRLDAIEERLARLESLLAASVPARPAAPPGPSPATPSAPPRTFETAFGLTWISRIGVITVVLALAFFFEYAFENHWITEWGRVALGLGCGAVSLFFGERFWRGLERTYAQALTAAGVAFLYLSFCAAFSLYHLMVQAAAFGLMLLTAVAAGGLALRYDGAAIAAMGLLSGFATPFLLGSRADSGPVLAYLLAIAAAGWVIADRRAWSASACIAFLGFWAAYGVWYAQSGAGLRLGLVFALLTASFLLFLAWPVWRVRRRNQPLRLPDLLILALNAGFYFGACYGLLESGYGIYDGTFAVAIAVVQMGMARLLWRRDTGGTLLAAAVAWALLVLAAPIQFVGYRVTIAWALEGGAIAWIGMRLADRRAVYGSAVVFTLVLARLALVDSAMYAGPGDYRELANARFFAFVVSAVAFWGAAWWVRRGPFALLAYAAGHGVLLWGLSLEAVGWAERVAAPQNFSSVASTSISVLIAAYAVALVAAGVFQRHAPTRLLGAALIGLVVGKLYLYDVWLLGQFYRMAAFAILGVLLLAVSYFYSRFRDSVETWWRP
jgi:uncharacterized membrane protein